MQILKPLYSIRTPETEIAITDDYSVITNMPDASGENTISLDGMQRDQMGLVVCLDFDLVRFQNIGESSLSWATISCGESCPRFVFMEKDRLHCIYIGQTANIVFPYTSFNGQWLLARLIFTSKSPDKCLVVLKV